MENKQDGFIYLWRQLLKSDIWKHDANLLKLFIWCLLKATHQPIKSNNTIVERGQFFTGKYVMSEETGMKPSTAWGKLKKLKELGVVDTQVTNNFTLITVCQYSTYQNRDLPQPVNPDTLYKDNNNYNNTTTVVEQKPVVKKKLKAKPREETQPVLKGFCNKYRDRFKQPYHISWAKDSACIKRLLDGGFTAGKLFELMDVFLNDKDSFLLSSGYTIPIFSSRINRYITQQTNEPPIYYKDKRLKKVSDNVYDSRIED